MESGIIDAIGKLSIEVVAILTLAYIIYTQGKGHDKMSKSIDRLTMELGKRNEDHFLLKKTIEKIHTGLKDHRTWSRNTVGKLGKKNCLAFTGVQKK